MRILFERSGGFAGMRLTASMDTGSLPDEEAQELEDLVNAAGFFDLPAQIAGQSSGADQFRYKLTVEDGGRRHTVEVGETAVPDPLRPLLQRLTAAARRR